MLLPLYRTSSTRWAPRPSIEGRLFEPNIHPFFSCFQLDDPDCPPIVPRAYKVIHFKTPPPLPFDVDFAGLDGPPCIQVIRLDEIISRVLVE